MTPIELDDPALAGGMRKPGTSTGNDTVHRDLCEAAERCTRLSAFEQLMQLGDADAGNEAWRERKGPASDLGRDADA